MDNIVDIILSDLKNARGIDFSGYRRSMVERRLLARMNKLGIRDHGIYLSKLNSDEREFDNLIESIGINVSSFFRNPLFFELLYHNILPDIIENKRKTGSREVRIWCSGCASGEEAYSIAIILHEILEKEIKNWQPYIFATDISVTSLKLAAEAVYTRESLESTKLGIVDKYFLPRGESFLVQPVIKKMVQFSQDDLTSQKSIAPTESVFGTFDLVLCRNVLIYFSLELQGKVFHKLHLSLSSKGYLVLGEAESLIGEIKPKFVTIDSRNRIFQKIV